MVEKTFKVNNSLSVGADVNKAYLEALKQSHKLGFEGKAYNAYPANITTPNIQAVLGALNYIRPTAIEVLTAPMVAEKIAEPQQNGRWGDRAVTIKTKEYLGTTSPDDGGEADGLNSDVNYGFEGRGVYYYMTSWRATDLEEATVDLGARENLRADKAEAAMRNLALDRNRFAFSGVTLKGSNVPVQGFLNANGLPDYQVVSTGASGETEFATKTPEEMYNDIVAAYTALNAQTDGIVADMLASGRGKLKLCIAANVVPAFTKANTYGVSAQDLLEKNYANVEVIAVPQFNAAQAGSNVFYLVYDEGGKSATFINSYIEMARAYPIFVKDSVVSQKISAATSGVVLQYPMFVVRYAGC